MAWTPRPALEPGPSQEQAVGPRPGTLCETPGDLLSSRPSGHVPRLTGCHRVTSTWRGGAGPALQLSPSPSSSELGAAA